MTDDHCCGRAMAYGTAMAYFNAGVLFRHERVSALYDDSDEIAERVSPSAQRITKFTAAPIPTAGVGE